MSEPNDDPPLVRKVEDIPLVRAAGEAQPPAEATPVPPAKRPGPGFWESLLWCVVFLGGQVVGLAVVTVGVFLLFALSANDPKAFTDEQLNGLKAAAEPHAPDTTSPMPQAIAEALGWGMIAAQVVALVLVLVVIPLRVGPGWRRQIGVRRPSGLHLFLVLLIVPGFIVLPDAVQSLFRWLTGWQPNSVSQDLSGLFSQLPLALTLLGVAIGPGIVEEFWCRGFLGRGLCARYGIAAGVFITSLLFALMHMNPAQIPAYLCMGAYLHFVYFATRSIWPAVLLHAMNNGMAVVLSLVLSPEKGDQPAPVVVPLTALALLIFGGVALWTGRAVARPVTASAEPAQWQPEYPGISAPPPGTGLRLEHEAASPVALAFTVVAFAAMLYLGYRFVI
jgi:membrane protease YdiL (CAAX protease family)